MAWWSRGWLLPLGASRRAALTLEKRAEPPGRTQPPDVLRRAQQAAGNRALAHAARDPVPPPSLKAALPTMTPRGRLAAPGRAIRVFDDGASHAAAEQMGAFAFSWRGDVYLGDRFGRPGAPTRHQALRHERVHALQARRRGPRAAEAALEREAERPGRDGGSLAADPERPHGLWWVVPLAVGAYILLRPKVANAPGRQDTPIAGPSDAQIVGEALALFAVPGGVARGLARLGYGVVGAYALGAAAGAVSYRGVQDIGVGRFSGIEAYIVDAATDAIIGAVVGGVARTLLRPADTARAVAIPESATSAFSRPLPMGPLSLYQRLMGVHRAPSGAIDFATGGFEAGGRLLPNLTGQFFPYGVDALIWLGAGAAGASLSPTREGADERGVTGLLSGLLANREPLPETRRGDGPFVFVGDPSLALGGEGAHGLAAPSSLACAEPGLAAQAGLAAPAIILVTPVPPWQSDLDPR